MDSQKYDWTRFRRVIRIKAPIERVFAAWASREGLESWFLKTARIYSRSDSLRDPKALAASGDRYHWQWYANCSTNTDGEFFEIQAPTHVAFTFDEHGNVKVSLKPDGEWTYVELIQEKIPDDEESRIKKHLGCRTGWTFFFANLKSVLESGVDLREKEVEKMTDETVNF